MIMHVLLFTIAQFLCFTRTSAVFCDWSICHPTEQYCCGHNICCNYFTYTTWYLWGGAVLIGLLLVLLYYILRPVRSDTDSDKTPIVQKQ